MSWVLALLQFCAFWFVGWAASDWLLTNRYTRNAPGAPEAEKDIEWPERLLFSVLGFVFFAVVCMVANIVTGGLIFGAPGVVAVAAIALVVFRLRRGSRPPQVPWRRVAAIAIPLVLLWMLPVFISGSAARSGDTPWHLGWTNQLLAGQPVPQGPAPEEVAANAYPWGFHAFLGALVRTVPGSDVMAGLIATQLLLILSLPLAAACIARRLSRPSGWAAALAAGGIGGFGWLALKSPAFATSPSEAQHGADLVIASPNSVYELFPPPLPRELGLVLLAIAGVMLAVSLERKQKWLLPLSGIALGTAGLVSVPALVAGSMWTGVAMLLDRERAKARRAALVFVPAAIVFLLWAGPVMRHLILRGGFVNVSPSLGREWPLWTALAAWGVLGPLAALGVLVWRKTTAARVALGFGAATIVLLTFAIARGRFDWPLAGNATVLHQGRIWPIAHLLAAAFAGSALWWLWSRLDRLRTVRTVAFATLVLAGLASPVLASTSLSDAMKQGRDGYPYGEADFEENSFIRQAARELGPDDTLLVEGPRGRSDRLAFHLFSFSGVRLARFDDPRLATNDLRIRYEELADRWDDIASGEGFAADFVVDLEGGTTGGTILARGEFSDKTWILVDSRRTDGEE